MTDLPKCAMCRNVVDPKWCLSCHGTSLDLAAIKRDVALAERVRKAERYNLETVGPPYHTIEELVERPDGEYIRRSDLEPIEVPND